ncbi:hypothetical protein C4571_02605 [Candidatus Parcubacteria bacterium]|nr:MAG: hypothetical protein C4571_02605 [Candidatus Parcubacteria bacterium]
MEQSESPILTKAFETAYALFKLADAIRHSPLAERLEAQALKLMESVSESDYRTVRRMLTLTGHILQLAVGTGRTHPANSQLIGKNLGELQEMISGIEKSPEPLKSSLEEILKGSVNSERTQNAMSREGKKELESGNPAMKEREIKKTDIFQRINHESFIQNQPHRPGSEMRQSAILERIRQIGNLPGQAGCRLKDVQEFMPGVSERTLRYDLQKLIEEGHIDRSGGGGPGTFYRIRERGVLQAPVSVPSLPPETT